jgi:hypothetical protein
LLEGSWAATDSRDFHFPIINYFVKNGFDLNYQSDLIAMFPGMHMLFASAARLFALNQLSLDGLPAFLFQSAFGVFFLAALLRIVRHTAVNSVAVAVLVLPAISTSYILYSWVWPTAELGSIALYAWMLALLVRTARVTAPVAISHSLLTAMSIFSSPEQRCATILSHFDVVVSGADRQPSTGIADKHLYVVSRRFTAICSCVALSFWPCRARFFCIRASDGLLDLGELLATTVAPCLADRH